MLNPTLAAGAGGLMNHVLPHPLHTEPLFSIGGYDFYITNHILMSLIAAVLLLVVFSFVASRVRVRGTGTEAYITRGRVAQLFETICQFIRDEVARPALGPLTDKYIGFVWTTFFFILFANLLGMIPVGPILRFVFVDPHLEHWGGTATGNLAVTGGLAIVAFLMIHITGIREAGLINYIKHYNPGPWFLAPLMIPLEIIGNLVKPFSLAVRLFANMVAGHLILAALISLIFIFSSYLVGVASVAAATALSLLELFVAFLQAYIFTFLTVLFIASVAVHEHDEHEEHEEHGIRESPGLEHAVTEEPPAHPA